MSAEAAIARIDRGALSALLNPNSNPNYVPFPNPILQCVQIKPLAATEGTVERFRVVFSDVSNFVQSMLATQANYVIQEGKMKKGSVVRLKAFQSNSVKGRRILIVLDLEVLEELGVHDKLGEPKPLEFKQEDNGQPQPTTISSNGFYGNAGQQQQPRQSLPSRTNSTSHGNIYPIEALSPYAHKWTIKARCTNKSDVKTWHNRNGEGKLFSINLLDESGEIKATGFNDQCDAFFELFHEGSVYYITSPCKVKPASKQYTALNNDYELNFERDTVVEKAEEESDVPQVRFNFTSIGELQSVEKDAIIDTIGVLKEVGETIEITSKSTSKPYDKRELTLVDDSGFSVRIAIWGTTATSFDAQSESIIAFKGVKVSDYGGRSLSLLSSGSMAIDPDIEEAHKLKGWYEGQGRSNTFATYQGMGGSMGEAGGRSDKYKTISQVKDENIGMGDPDQSAYFDTKGTIVYVRAENVAYPACRNDNPPCNKKVLEDGNGQWRCEKCNKTWPEPLYRYTMSINVCDHTGQLWLTCFDDVGKRIVNMSANDLMALRASDEKEAADALHNANGQTFTFNCRAKMDNYQDQQRMRYTVSSATPLSFSKECDKLAKLIKLYSLDD
ncbi:MAG: Replication factor A protein 1 [Icmadophila ericetorum]|nr:Replication factor A protein 1 [Icmadophila ericetorum]